MLNLTDAANVGSFLGGVASTLGLIGLIGIWLQWRNNHENQKKETERMALEENRYREQRLKESKALLRNEIIQQELAILSWAHEAFAAMNTERNRLYLEGISTAESDTLKRNYAIKAASKANLVFAFRLSSWLQTLSKIENVILDVQQIEKLVASTIQIAQEDQRILKYFAIAELDILKTKADNTEQEDSFWKQYKISNSFSISPLDYENSWKAVFSELAQNWQNLKSSQ